MFNCYGTANKLIRFCTLFFWSIIKQLACWKWQNGVVFTLIFFLVFSLLVPSTAFAINQEINYQGKLTDSAGTVVADATYSIVFSLYTADSGGVSLCTRWIMVG